MNEPSIQRAPTYDSINFVIYVVNWSFFVASIQKQMYGAQAYAR